MFLLEPHQSRFPTFPDVWKINLDATWTGPSGRFGTILQEHHDEKVTWHSGEDAGSSDEKPNPALGKYEGPGTSL